MPARLLWLALFAAIAGCAAPGRVAPSAVPAANPSPSWDAYVGQFLDGYFATHPDAAVGAGKHEYDGQLPDWSAEGLAREAARLHAERDRAAAFPEAALDERQRVERGYLLAVVDGELFWREASGFPASNPSWYSGGVDPNVYTTRPYAPLDVRLRAFTAYAENIPRATAQIQANMRTPLPRTYVALGQLVFGGMASYLRDDVPGIFAAVADPAAQARFRTANAAAIAAFERLSDWYKAQEPAATDAFALGPDRFRAMLLATERVDVPLDRLTAIGQADLARNRAAAPPGLRRRSRRARPRRRASSEANALKPDGSPVEAARRQLTDLRAFVEAHDVVTIPGHGAGARRGGAAVRTLELRLHQHPRAVRAEPALGLLHLAARRRVDAGRADGLPAGPHQPAVRLGARGLAGPLPSVSPRQPVAVDVRAGVRRLRLCRGLGALHRGDDVGARAWARAAPRFTSGSSRTRCCATSATSRRSGSTRAG